MIDQIPTIAESLSKLCALGLNENRISGDMGAALPTPASEYNDGPFRISLFTDAGHALTERAAEKMVRGKEPIQAFREANSQIAIALAKVHSLHAQKPDISIDEGRETLKRFSALFDRTEIQVS